jgi:hypothetical protein
MSPRPRRYRASSGAKGIGLERLGEWSLAAAGGRSINIGTAGKLRMEPGLSTEDIQAVMRLVVEAPAMRGVLRRFIDGRGGGFPSLEEIESILARVDGKEPRP